MVGFAWGLVAGLLVALVVAAASAVVGYRRLREWERRARQAERLAELGTLTGGLAHEIKNPLSTVQLNLQLLQEDVTALPGVSPRVVNRLATMRQETQRLRDILEDFLRYAGRMELDRKPTDLDQLVGELVDFLAPQAEMQRVQIRHRVADPPIVAGIDPKLLKQALLNLMLNAIQAMGSGGELILAVRRVGGTDAAIDVIDTGPGISPEEQKRIFEAYYSKRRGGTGLGLAMTQRIAGEHGGRVVLQSEPGKGSCFSIVLPVEAGSATTKVDVRPFDGAARGA
jgi:signal transduction histidine kinase